MSPDNENLAPLDQDPHLEVSCREISAGRRHTNGAQPWRTMVRWPHLDQASASLLIETKVLYLTRWSWPEPEDPRPRKRQTHIRSVSRGVNVVPATRQVLVNEAQQCRLGIWTSVRQVQGDNDNISTESNVIPLIHDFVAYLCVV